MGVQLFGLNSVGEAGVVLPLFVLKAIGDIPLGKELIVQSGSGHAPKAKPYALDHVGTDEGLQRT